MFRQKQIRLHAAQTSLLALDKLYPGLNGNHRSVAVEITGPIDIETLNSAFDLLIARHEMLRAVVGEDETGPYFHISPLKKKYLESDLPLKIIDVTHFNSSPNLEDLSTTLKKINEQSYLDKPFNLQEGPLWRSILVKIAENKYHFSMLFNHIIIDEGSIGVLLNDLSAFYNILLDNPEEKSPIHIPSLADIDLKLSSNQVEERLTHWKKELKDLNIVHLQTDFLPPQSFRFAGKRRAFTLGKDILSKIESNTQFKGYSFNSILLTILYSLLYRYSDETDICIGITSANRRHNNLDEKIVGQLASCFFNSIPLRLSFSEDITFLNLLSKVKDSLSKSLKNQLPLDSIFQQAISAKTKSSLRTASPFNIMLVFNEVKPTLSFLKTTATQPIELDLGHNKFPYFGINIDKYPDGTFECFIEYNIDLFAPATIDRFIGHFNKSLEYIAENPQTKISAIPLLLDTEKALINKFNQTELLTTNNLVHDFFHKQALAYPDEIFLVYHNDNGDAERFTYKQIDSLASQLANYLIDLNVGPNIKVGICLSRSPNLIISMLAVLKAGGIVVTMETKKCPLLVHKIENADIKIILVDQQTQSIIKNGSQQLLNIQDEETVNKIKTFDGKHPVSRLTPEHPAYIMYTSGTSGDKPSPKGVIITHLGLANLLHALPDDLKLRPLRKVICWTVETFDAFWFDFLVSIVAERGQLHFCFEQGRCSPKVIQDIIRKEDLNFGVFLPNLLDNLDPQLSLDDVIVMGESPHKDTLELWASARPDRRIWVGYGPTEATICTALFHYVKGSDASLIGQPLRNMKKFILNPTNLSHCPIGVPGEIYIAGPGLAQAYVDNGPLTAEKFPQVIFDDEKSSFQLCDSHSNQVGAMRLYKTGDFGCYRLQSNDSVLVKFIGRKDMQIKLNGVRVEIGFVETLLRNHPLIRDVAILPNEEKTALTAYIVPAADAVTMEEIRKQLQEYLPKTLLPPVAYPKNIRILNEFPINQNGKVDLRALPSPQSLFPEIFEIEHLTELQSKIRGIWMTILGISEISIHQSYVELGGDSLSKARIESVLNKTLKLTSYADMNFLPDSMTIKSLSEKLEPLLIIRSNLLRVGPGAYVNPHSSAVIFSDDHPDLFFKKNKSRDATPESRKSSKNTNTDKLSHPVTNLRTSNS